MDLSGKGVIITGAAAGIGAATARLFARRGAGLALLDIDEEGLRKVEPDCRSSGAKVFALRCDTSLLPELDRAIRETLNRLEGIDILINNAIFRAIGPFLEIKEDEFDRSLFTNIKGYFFFAQKVVPHMLKRGGGKVINIASTFGFVGSPSLSALLHLQGRSRHHDQGHGRRTGGHEDPGQCRRSGAHYDRGNAGPDPARAGRLREQSPGCPHGPVWDSRRRWPKFASSLRATPAPT